MYILKNLKPRLPDKISRDFVYRCMGFGNHTPDSVNLEIIDKCEALVLRHAQPRVIAAIETKERITPYLTGNLIVEHLAQSDLVVLLAVTLGVQTDTLIRKYEITDMSVAIGLDACASSLVEDICDDINQQLEDFAKSNYYDILRSLNINLQQEVSDAEKLSFTSRFSPGYGDWSLEAQNMFQDVLDTHKAIGLTQSREHLLIPRKSVTAILGIITDTNLSENCSNTSLTNGTSAGLGKAAACNICLLSDTCSLKASGSYCGKF